MNKNKITLTLLIGLLSAGLLANQQPTSNANPAYSQSNVQAQLRLNIKENAETVHFIRDNNDPKIITKTYVLKHADAYEIRPYIREMVQALRVDYNNPAGRANPDYYNTYNKDNAAKTEKIFVPTGIECIKFTDNTNMLIVSAEDYRFKSNENGMGIDDLITKLDVPEIKNSSGQPKFIYFPSYRPAKELLSLIKLVGANVSNDTTELIGGKDKVEVDEDLNCLFFNTALYSRQNIEEMLNLYDIAHPEVKITCTIYELNTENDGMLGVDFQSWKNNDGIKFLQTGATYARNMNLSNLTNIVHPDGTINTNYFNFQPKWNSKFLDFLVSKGKAEIVSTADLTIQNGSKGTILRRSGILYAALAKIPTAADKKEHGNTVEVKPINDKFKIQLEITPFIAEKASSIEVKVSTVSMLGFNSKGEVRTTAYESTQKIMLGNGKNKFYLGGIDKTQVVSDSSGLPFFKDLPLVGWLFSTERESLKKSNLVLVAECEIIQPNTLLDENSLQQIEVIKNSTASATEFNQYGYRQYLLDKNR